MYLTICCVDRLDVQTSFIWQEHKALSGLSNIYATLQLYRYLFFIGALFPIWWAGGMLTTLLVTAIESKFFTSRLMYFAYGMRVSYLNICARANDSFPSLSLWLCFTFVACSVLPPCHSTVLIDSYTQHTIQLPTWASLFAIWKGYWIESVLQTLIWNIVLCILTNASWTALLQEELNIARRHRAILSFVYSKNNSMSGQGLQLDCINVWSLSHGLLSIWEFVSPP